MNGDDAREQRVLQAQRAEGNEESITQVPTTDKLQTQEVQNPMANFLSEKNSEHIDISSPNVMASMKEGERRMTDMVADKGAESIAEMVWRLTGEFDKEFAKFEEFVAEIANASTTTAVTTEASAQRQQEKRG